jgi:hypothetical protein
MINFGKIKNYYNNILSENISKKDKNSKTIFKKYIKKIKNNKILREQFNIYSNIENKYEPDYNKALLYVNELFSNIKLTKNDVIKENEDLTNELGIDDEFDLTIIKPYHQKAYDLFKSKDYDASVSDNNKYSFNNEEELNSFIEELNNLGIGNEFLGLKQPTEKDELYENIHILLTLRKNIDNIDKITESKDYIVKYINNNIKYSVIKESFGIPTDNLTTILLTKFKNKYNDLNENDYKILSAIISENITLKENTYNELKNEVILLINNKDVNGDLNLKEKLLLVKERLLSENNIFENYEDNLIKLLNIKNSL